MILIAGIADESPVAMAIEAAEARGIDHVVFDQRDHGKADAAVTIDAHAGVGLRLSLPDGEVDLNRLTGAYVRMMDDRYLPGLADLEQRDPRRSRSARLHQLLHDWCNLAPVRIANRPVAMMSNTSKTYQAAVIRRCGFATPDTLVTNDPGLVEAFVADCAAQGDEVIYKSVSGARSIVQTFTPADRERLHRIRWCPTQFQRRVAGTDMRVHVVGTRCFAARIESAATDYRYASRQTGEEAEVHAAELAADVAERCVRLAATLDLPFAGIDLRRTPGGEWVCFEVNPSPAYSYYQSRTGTDIAQALVDWLALADRQP